MNYSRYSIALTIIFIFTSMSAQYYNIAAITDATNSKNQLHISILRNKFKKNDRDSIFDNTIMSNKLYDEHLMINLKKVKAELYTLENVEKLFQYCPPAKNKLQVFHEINDKVYKDRKKTNYIILGVTGAGILSSTLFLKNDQSAVGIFASVFAGLLATSINQTLGKRILIENMKNYDDAFFQYKRNCLILEKVDSSSIDVADKADSINANYSRYIYNDALLNKENTMPFTTPISGDSIASGNIAVTNSKINRTNDPSASKFDFITTNTSYSVSMKILNNEPENARFYGVNFHPLALETGGFTNSFNISMHPFFMAKGYKISGNLMHIYDESRGKFESNTNLNFSQRSYSYGFNIVIPIVKTNKKSNQSIDLGGQYSARKLQLKTMKYLSFDAGWYSKQFLFINNSDEQQIRYLSDGSELKNPYFYLGTNTIKTGFAYNIFNSTKLIPLDKRFDKEKNKSYHTSLNVSILYNMNYKVNTILYNEREITVPGLIWNKLGYSASISYHLIGKRTGWSIGLEYSLAPSFEGYDNQYYSFWIGGSLGNAVHRQIKSEH